MGHDIYAYRRPRDEVAYLRRNMGNPEARIIYRLLDAEHYDAGVSGDGSWAVFYRSQLEEAASRAEVEGVPEDIRSFLKLALDADPGDDGIIILFG